MEDTEIASLGVGSAAISLNIRVLRKWKPMGRPSETCYLLVDKQVYKYAFSYCRIWLPTVITLTDDSNTYIGSYDNKKEIMAATYNLLATKVIICLLLIGSGH